MAATAYLAVLAVLVIAASGGLYLYTKTRGDTSRLFAPRLKRLTLIERTALDGGRRLLLVRRDDVEHLILIGGPIDLVVETGIRAEGLAMEQAAADMLANRNGSVPVAAGKAAERETETLELTPLDELKAVP
jgi:hypothetical protein